LKYREFNVSRSSFVLTMGAANTKKTAKIALILINFQTLSAK